VRPETLLTATTQHVNDTTADVVVADALFPYLPFLRAGGAHRTGSTVSSTIWSASCSPSCSTSTTEQYANDRIEADHGRLKARLRPMRGLKRLRSAAATAAGHAFVQNLRRGHYELALDVPPDLRVAAAVAELAATV